MNELLFFLQIGAILSSIYVFSKFDKAGLFCIFILQIVFANLFLLKQISLFGLNVTTTDCFTIGSIFTLNIISESYGKKAASQAISIGLFAILFVPLMSFFLLSYTPIESCSMHDVYSQLLSPSSYIFCVSIVCMVASQKLDTFLFSMFRKKRSFTTSMISSTSISQFFDTCAFTFLALSSFAHDLFAILFFSYFVKMISILTMSTISSKLVRKEGKTA